MKKPKKKAAPAKGEGASQKNILVLRGSEEWKAWLESLAEANNAPMTVTVEQALREMSDRLKHRKPPRRIP